MARLECAFEDVDARVRAAGVTPDAGYRHWPEDLRSELESSWEFILDPGNYGRYDNWQATRARPVRERRHAGGPAATLSRSLVPVSVRSNAEDDHEPGPQPIRQEQPDEAPCSSRITAANTTTKGDQGYCSFVCRGPR